MSDAALSKVTAKGQVTVPQPIREQLHLQPGDVLEWRATAGGVIELRRLSGDVRALAGLLGTPDRRATIEELDEAIERHLCEKYHGQR